MTRVQLRENPPSVYFILKDYAIPPKQMSGRIPLSLTPNGLRVHWITKALGYPPEDSHKLVDRCHISNIEQLGSLDNIIVGGKIDQPLKSIDEKITDYTTLMVSWHWIKNCDGEFLIKQLDDP
ncbi:uncharacterized protein N7529_007130 [Penicillium soppii]|uniref:uncharacterized protein n=1 Tax=Penicillium soppii TaxID=69789 RepID=UPI002548EDD9|nr:uncharacterized protein N7529_007130 [Penicillium soppii]KAJ5865214.1 hypothetical protein N7529_007130 [Penicillium soppii]